MSNKTKQQNTLTPSQEVGKQIAHLFSGYLLTNEPAIKHLESRGISRKMIEDEDVGFCPPFLNYWFPLMLGRIIVTIKDVHGNIVAFAGRQYEPSAEAAKKALRQMYEDKPADAEKRILMWERGKWLNEPFPKTKHLFNLNTAKDFARKRGYIIIVEGYFDALVLASMGLENTVAVCGTALTDRHIALISRYCKNVVLLLDGDKAGTKAATSMIPKLKEAELIPHSIHLPDGYDPDEFVLKVGGKRFRRVIENLISEGNQELKINLK